MNKERIGLGLFATLSALLLAWNLKLQSDINAFAPGVVEAPDDVSSMTGVQAERDVERRRAPRRAPSQGDRYAGYGDGPLPGGDAEPPVDEEAGEGEQRPRRRMDWDEIRSEMESDTVEIVESFSATQKWDPKVADEVIAILLDTSDEIGQLWTNARGEDGDDRSRYQIHREMEEIRNAAADEISEMIGQESYDALAEELFEARHRTFRRRHEG